MNPFRNILIGMDLSSMDKQLIDYLSFFSGPSPRLHFVHVTHAMQLTSPGSHAPVQLMEDQPENKRFLDAMRQEVSVILASDQFRDEYHVLKGQTTSQLLQYAETKKIDLTLIGKKENATGNSIASHRFLRGTTGSVLVVPEQKIAQIERILIATDFSEYSELTVKRALMLARQQPVMPEIHFVNIYDVPTDMAYRISRTEGQFAAIIRENVRSVVPDFLAKFDLSGIQHEFHLIENTRYNAAEHLIALCKSMEADLMIMGAKGHSVVSALLLGSVAERVLRYNEDTPLLIMRHADQ
ncbi:MAG: universal stress protein [Bacteroidia bacterium]|nr:universal stress protein [Bacteroidia bacterium]